MEIKTLYKYQRPDGGITTSLNPPVLEDIEYTETYRLIAAKGCLLTNGTVSRECTDVDDISLWSEVRVETDDDLETLKEKAKAYDIVAGKEE